MRIGAYRSGRTLPPTRIIRAGFLPPAGRMRTSRLWQPVCRAPMTRHCRFTLAPGVGEETPP